MELLFLPTSEVITANTECHNHGSSYTEVFNQHNAQAKQAKTF